MLEFSLHYGCYVSIYITSLRAICYNTIYVVFSLLPTTVIITFSLEILFQVQNSGLMQQKGKFTLQKQMMSTTCNHCGFQIINFMLQVEDLTRKSRIQDIELERTTHQLKEAVKIAGEESAKCKAAKEVIKALTAQVGFAICI